MIRSLILTSPTLLLTRYLLMQRLGLNFFCSLGGVRIGYTRPGVTPYMHLIPYHLPFFVQKHGCLKKFTGQGVEKNDDAKRIHFHKSNKWDTARDILCTESRQWELSTMNARKPPTLKGSSITGRMKSANKGNNNGLLRQAHTCTENWTRIMKYLMKGPPAPLKIMIR